jgi:hypothetical protein
VSDAASAIKGNVDQFGRFKNPPKAASPGDWVPSGTGAGAEFLPAQDNPSMGMSGTSGSQAPYFNFGSAHSSGFNMALCDRSVRMISYTIDPITHRYLGDRRDRQPIDTSIIPGW